MRAAREARGARRSATAGEDAMADMIYSLREFRRYTDALAVVAAVGCRLDDEPTLHHHQPIESPGETHESGKIRDPGCGVRLVSRLRVHMRPIIANKHRPDGVWVSHRVRGLQT